MKRRRNVYTFLIVVIFATLMLVISIAYAILSKKIDIKAKVTLGENQSTSKGYNVTYTIVNKWSSNSKYVFQIRMTLENNTDELLDGWKISIKNPENGEVLNYFNVNCNVTTNAIEFSNVSYNAQIPSKEKMSFEFQIATTNPYYKPEDIVINGEIIKPPEEDTEKPEEIKKAEILIEKEGGWGTENEFYSQVKILIKNTGNVEIHSWQFDINFKDETTIEQIWNVNIEKIADSKYRLSNSDYNGVIQPNSEIILGGIIKSSTKDTTYEITNIILK